MINVKNTFQHSLKKAIKDQLLIIAGSPTRRSNSQNSSQSSSENSSSNSSKTTSPTIEGICSPVKNVMYSMSVFNVCTRSE